MKPADIMNLHTLGQPAVAPDGRLAVVPVIRPDLDADGYRGHLWIVPTDGSAPPRPFTTGWRDTAPAYSPDGAWLAFLRASEAEGAGARPQLYIMPTDGGEPRRLTDHPLGVGAPVWSPDSRRIAYIARVPDEGRYREGRADKEPPRRITTLQYREDNLGFFIDRRAHVFVLNPFADPAEPVQATEGDFDHSAVTWGPDGQQLAFVSARHDTRDSDLVSDIWTCAPDGSHPTQITGVAGGVLKLSIDQACFAPDGESMYFTATELGPSGRDVLGRNHGLFSLPAGGTAQPRRLTDAETIHLVRGGAIEATPDGVLARAESRGAVELLRVAGADEPMTLISGQRQIEGLAHTKSVLVAVVSSPGSSGELIALAGETERAITSFGSIASPYPIEEITGTSPDGYPVHGWIVRPAGPGPHPVLLMIHGGPFAQYGWRLFDEAQVYADGGYAVVMGNPRGSSGYGQAHGRSVIGDAATHAAADLLALLDAAFPTSGLDASRVGVQGGSYGGYMTTWLAGHHGERFKAAVSERAVNAIDSFHGSSDIGWVFAAALWGDDPSGWAEQNPLSFADRIAIPMLIIHSEHDWRCPVEQAQRLFVALRLRGVPAEMLLFPGEGHELSRAGRPSHRVARFEAILDWWARHL
ncbi:MAG TPA: S9 family peptidase [Streptosporangiaceae bacterium]